MSQRWYVTKDGRNRLGPFPAARLRELARQGQLQPRDMVLLEGQRRWVPAAQVRGLFEPPAAAAPPEPKPARPRVRPGPRRLAAMEALAPVLFCAAVGVFFLAAASRDAPTRTDVPAATQGPLRIRPLLVARPAAGQFQADGRTAVVLLLVENESTTRPARFRDGPYRFRATDESGNDCTRVADHPHPCVAGRVFELPPGEATVATLLVTPPAASATELRLALSPLETDGAGCDLRIPLRLRTLEIAAPDRPGPLEVEAYHVAPDFTDRVRRFQERQVAPPTLPK